MASAQVWTVSLAGLLSKFTSLNMFHTVVLWPCVDSIQISGSRLTTEAIPFCEFWKEKQQSDVTVSNVNLVYAFSWKDQRKQPPARAFLGYHSPTNPAVCHAHSCMHPASSSLLLHSLLLKRGRIAVQKSFFFFCIVCKRHPSFLFLTLPWYIPAPPRRAVLYGAYTGKKLLLQKRRRGIEQEGVCVCVCVCVGGYF